MKALRIILSQNTASYKKEEADINKMTYPLPPFSTVIGALHNTCSYKEYHPMDVSIAGKYEALQDKVYRDQAFLNNLNDDRGFLVKCANEDMLSMAIINVAYGKAQGSSFEKEIMIDVYDEELLTEYQHLRRQSRELAERKKDIVNPQIKDLSVQIRELKAKIKLATDEEVSEIKVEIEKLTSDKDILQSEFDAEEIAHKKAYSQYRSVNPSIKHYEILSGVQLVLHIKSDEDTLKDIYENIDNLTSIGRSEDFVDVKSCEYVELHEDVDEIYSENSAYIAVENVRDKTVFAEIKGEQKISEGTLYFINKDYIIEDKKRVFNKKRVVYMSGFYADSTDGNETGIYVDEDNHVVNFI